MRVAVDQRAAREQGAVLDQGNDHRLGRLEHVQALEAGNLPGVGAVLGHRVRDVEAVARTQLEIVLAMARGDVDQAGALLGGDEVAGQQRHGEIVATGMAGERMAGDAAGERRAVELGQRLVAEDAGGVGDLGQPLDRDHQPLAHPRQGPVADLADLDQPIGDVRRHRRPRGWRGWSRGSWSR